MSALNIANFIWGIADDVLRDIYVRGKYRDVILPMTVIRRLDAVLEPTKQAVLDMKAKLDKAGIANPEAALRQTAGQAFYNTSPYTLRDLKARARTQQLKTDFEAYLDGFAANVQEVLDKFKFRNQLPTLAEADILGAVLEKFLDPGINLSPKPVLNGDGSVRLPGLDNHSMGTLFEELIRRFNEENNEEAGEHFTPRDVVKLMADLIFLPIADKITSGTYLVYDGACGTGGMLTVAEERLLELARAHQKEVSVHLFGQESGPETYAISKADLLLKGEGDEAENFRLGSTLSQDGFPAHEFDFMLSNPPYGKSWKTDLERMGGKKDMKDPRFIINHGDEADLSLITRSSDGQLLFLVNNLTKMKNNTPLGSRIAEVHNGSSLFTGDAGQGESNIRRWILENDWLEAIIALPTGMFYNTGIATYIWVLSNRKEDRRKGKVQLIDASGWYQPRRKNLGKKNCDLGDADIARILQTFMDFKETEQSKIFDNTAFGFWKIIVERPLRLKSQFTSKAVEALRYASGDEDLRKNLYAQFGDDIYSRWNPLRADIEASLNANSSKGEDEDEGEEDAPKTTLPEKRRKKLMDPTTWQQDRRLLECARALFQHIGGAVFDDHNRFREAVDDAIDTLNLKVTGAERKAILKAVSWRDEAAAPVIAKIHKPGKAKADPLYGRFEATVGGKPCVVEYESDTDLRDSEQVPLLEAGGIEAFFRREVLPYTQDAWIDDNATKIGYEISFTRYFYKPQALRSLEDIRADIEALEQETEGLLDDILLKTNDKAA